MNSTENVPVVHRRNFSARQLILPCWKVSQIFLTLVASLEAVAGDTASAPAIPSKVTKANYELAARWTPTKVGKLVFDTTVTAHWLDSGDRFWYTYENSHGRRFYIVDPAAKTRNLLFDPARMAASLTEVTGIPYEAQHVP